jgi:agmatine deiminase
MSTPRLSGFSMPPEWAPHERTWMEFPPANETFGDDVDGELLRYRRAWTAVTNAIARFEPVSLVCNIGDADAARALVGDNVTIYETPTNDAWVRDSGPTFLTHPDGRLGATHWRFNAWGNGGFSKFDDEQHVGAFIAGMAGAELFSSEMVNEGGGIHVDGQGTVMVTNTVQLDPGRNPEWVAERADTELRSYIGTEQSIWIPRGLTRDYERFGTRGHIDMFAAFVRPGVVVAHAQTNPNHPDYEVSREYTALLRKSRDAQGRLLEVISIAAPTVTHIDDEIVDWSYINHYVCNGAVILCAFNDPRDEDAAQTLAHCYPGSEIVLVDARSIFDCGGGIHCITQQQPAVGSADD